MSVFTQFVGDSVPFGQLFGLWDYRNNPTVNGVEYLKTGVIKAISGYSTLVANYPALSLNVQPGTAYSFTSSNTATNAYLTDGTRYYVFNSVSNPRYGTNVTSAWTSTLTGTPQKATDACRFGTSTTLIAINSADATQNQYVIGTAATTIATTTVAMNVLASNTAGTLAVMANSNTAAANNIWTSTNGTAWTSRTPAGATGTDVFSRAMWSTVGNCFVYFGNSASTVYTTTDGFTLTSRGVPTGLASGASGTSGTGNNKYCASSASSTLFSVIQNSVGYIVKTTNGTSYTATPITSLFDAIAENSAPTLVYLNSAYYALFPTGLDVPTPRLFKSTDEGTTWTKVPSIFISPYAFLSATAFYTDYLALMNGNIIAFTVVSSGLSNGYYGVLNSYDTATHIGLPLASVQVAGNTSIFNAPNYYIRIK